MCPLNCVARQFFENKILNVSFVCVLYVKVVWPIRVDGLPWQYPLIPEQSSVCYRDVFMHLATSMYGQSHVALHLVICQCMPSLCLTPAASTQAWLCLGE